MTTPYRKAAEVNEPRVRYGWRLTGVGHSVLAICCVALMFCAAWTVWGLAAGYGAVQVSGAALGGLTAMTALVMLVRCIHETPFLERYEKP